jgi:hypothetical protein
VTPDRPAVVRADLIRRLRPVCLDLSEEDFLRLVDEIAERQLKYERAN